MTERKIDVFPHFDPPRYWERVKEVAPRFAALPNIATRPSLFDVDARFRLMDRFEGYVQVLTLGPPVIDDVATGQVAVDLARLANDTLADMVARHPDRFLGFAASLPMQDVDAALREADRAIGQLGALGVQIHTNVHGHPLDEPQFEPFFAHMTQLDRVIWVHPARPASVPDYPTESSSKYNLHLKFGWPYETTIFMSRMVYSGVMDRYPRLKILTHHAGGFVPHLAGRLALQHDTPEMRAEIGVDDRFDAARVTAAYRRFYGDTVFSGAHHPLACALEFFPDDHLLFGTDMPMGLESGEMFVRETIQAIEEVAVGETQRRKLFEENAQRLLGIR